MKIYKIRDKQTGLFSTGGLYPKWSKIGKVWKTQGNLKSHLNMLQECGFLSQYNNTEVIELETIENWIIPTMNYVEKGTDIN